MKTPQSIKGMHDLLPADATRWRRMEQAFRDRCDRYGFGEVRTPLLEPTELFRRGVGETTDIVEKEMYTFTDRSGESVTLRPEGTASAVRAYLSGPANEEPIARWYYAGPMFRGERPAKGRTRQFSQLGAEIYGDAGPASDAELIDFGYGYIQSLGIASVEVQLNSIGSGNTKERYRDALLAYFEPLREKLSADSQRRLGTNPLRIIDSKDPQDIALRPGAPVLSAFWSDEDKRHFDEVQALLTKLGTRFVVDPTIVRGLDYYTRTLFEYRFMDEGLGAQSSLGAGGRYDNLIAELGGRPTPAVGFALGCERLALVSSALDVPASPTAFVIALAKGDELGVQAEALLIARELRDAGIPTRMDTRFGKADRQFKQAERAGSRAGIVLGSAEVAAGTVNLKDLAARTQRTVARTQLVAEVRALLASEAPTGGGSG